MPRLRQFVGNLRGRIERIREGQKAEGCGMGNERLVRRRRAEADPHFGWCE